MQVYNLDVPNPTAFYLAYFNGTYNAPVVLSLVVDWAAAADGGYQGSECIRGGDCAGCVCVRGGGGGAGGGGVGGGGGGGGTGALACTRQCR